MVKKQMDDFNQKVKFSLKLKFFIVIVSIIIFISTSLVSFSLIKTKRGFEEEIEKRGLSEVKSLAYDAKYGVFTENQSIVDDLISGRLRKPDIVYIEIIGENEKKLARGSKKEYENVLFEEQDVAVLDFGDDISRTLFYGKNGEKIHEFLAPIMAVKSVESEYEDGIESFFIEDDEKREHVVKSKIGSVKIGISLKSVKDQITENFYISIVIIFVVVVISIVVSLIFINVIVHPIRKVAQTAMEISEGDLSKTVDVTSSDETGLMAANFNKMTISLKHTIKELEELKDGLEITVEKRTESLKQANIELEKAFNELKKLDEMKTDFISSVSHELRTPLTSVLGFANNAYKFYTRDIIPELPTDNKKLNKRSKTIEENLSIIISEGERLTRLINDVLDIAKIESGKLEWNIHKLDVVEICQKALAIVAGYPKEDKVEIAFEVNDIIRPVSANHDRLIQVLTNLMSNALKFTEKGKIVLKIVPFDDYVTISVSDSGYGISEDDKHKIFEKFRQLGDTLTNKPGGTGLGLPICKQIIEHFGGTIRVESEKGKGSQFYFTLNYWTEKDETCEQDKVYSPLEGQLNIEKDIENNIITVDKGKKSNILIVDDDQYVRKLLRQEIEEAGYNILEAENGEKAIMMVKNKDNRIGLILLDIMLPGIDGFDVLRVLKSNRELSHIPVIIISAYENENKIYQLGAHGFLHKPIDIKQLFKYIGSSLDKIDKKSLLIIDSDNNIVHDLRTSLESCGYIVSNAKNCEEGVAKARNDKPDIIILDLILPEIQKGLETLKTLRTDAKTSNIHIILVADKLNEDTLKIAEALEVNIQSTGNVVESIEKF